MENKSVIWLLRVSLILLISLCLYMLYKLAPLWTPLLEMLKVAAIPFVIAGFITYLLHPLIEGLHNRGIPRALAILLIYVLFFGGVGFGLYKLIPNIMIQLKDLGENIPLFMEMYQQTIENIYMQTSGLPEGFHQRIEQLLHDAESFIDDKITNILSFMKNIVNYIIIIGIIPFLTFYFLKDIDGIKKMMWYMTPNKWRENGRKLLQDIDESLGGYIRGQLLVALLIGILAAVGFWVIDIKYPLLLGVIVAVTDIIPYFGPILGAIPAIIIAFTISLKKALFVILLIFGIQIIEGNVLAPLIVGKSLQLHPVVIIFALLAGEQLGGIVGLIVAVPIFAIIKVIVIHLKMHATKKEGS